MTGGWSRGPTTCASRGLRGSRGQLILQTRRCADAASGRGKPALQQRTVLTLVRMRFIQAVGTPSSTTRHMLRIAGFSCMKSLTTARDPSTGPDDAASWLARARVDPLLRDGKDVIEVAHAITLSPRRRKHVRQEVLGSVMTQVEPDGDGLSQRRGKR